MSRFDWDRVRRERGLDRPWSPDTEGWDLAAHDRQRREADAKKRQKARERAAMRRGAQGAKPSKRAKKRKPPPKSPLLSPHGVQRTGVHPVSLEVTSIAEPPSTKRLQDAARFAVSATTWRAFEDWLATRGLGDGHLVFTDQDSLLVVSLDGGQLVLRRATDRGSTVEGLPGAWSELGRAPRGYAGNPEALGAVVRQTTKAKKPCQLRWVRVAS